MNQVKGILLLALSGALFAVAAAALFAMLRSLGVQSTLSAIESAFGSLVIAILLLVLARKTFLAGKARLRDHRED
jgi:predicted membrane protein